MSDMTLLILTPGSADTLTVAAGKLNNAIRPRAGEWITSPSVATTAGRNAGLASYAPIIAPRALAVTHLAVVVTDALDVTDVTLRLGLYADDGTGQGPASRLADSGEIAVSAPGVYAYALPTPLALSEGKLWGACVLHGTLDNDGTGDPGCALLGTDGRDDGLVVADPARIILDPNRRCRSQDGVLGALPATAAPDDTNAPNAVRVFLQVE